MLSLVLLALGLLCGAAAASGGRRATVLTWSLLALIAGAAFAWLTDPYEIRKLLGTLVMPAGLTWLLLLAAAAVASRRTPTWFSCALWVTWLFFGVAGNVWLGNALIARLEAPYTAIDPFAQEPMDAVVVLGGGISATDGGRITLGGAGDRVVLGARLERAGLTGLLITTGPVIAATGGSMTVPDATAELWRAMGVPDEHILKLNGPRTTAEEIRAVAELATEHQWKRLGLVTSGYHLRRAVGLCRAADLEPVPLAAELATPDPRLRPLHLVPQAGGFESMHRACWELVGDAAGSLAR